MGVPGDQRPTLRSLEINGGGWWPAPTRKKRRSPSYETKIERLREQNRLLALEIHRIGQQILEERDRADRMAVYERQNASLREEISRIHAGGRTSLRAGANEA